MPTLTTAKQVISRCQSLMSLHRERNRKILDWYEMLALTPNPDIPRGMENFTGNDPKTFYNFMSSLMSTSIISHSLDTERLNEEQTSATDGISELVQLGWKDNFRQARKTGQGTWMNRFSSYLLAQGQYAVLCRAEADRLRAVVWNPYQVFADWNTDFEGPFEVARVYDISADKANQLLRTGFYNQVSGTVPRRRIRLYSYYGYNDEGVVYNTVVMLNEIIYYKEYPELNRLPVYVSAAGGVIDIDMIMQRNSLFNGEGILATNYGLYRNINRTMTHIAQMTKDAAQPPIIEQKGQNSPSSGKLVDENKLFKRAYVIRIGAQDEVSAMALPSIPPESSEQLIRMNDMRQRGSVPDAAMGNLQGSGVNSLIINQVTQASRASLMPYWEAATDLFNEIDEYWAKTVIANKWTPYKWKRPKNLPPVEDIEFDVDLQVHIPGDLVARATVMRMLAPDAQVATETALDLVMPEVKDPKREIAKVISGRVQLSEMEVIRTQIESYWTRAQQLQQTNPRAAKLYNDMAAALEAQVTQMAQPEPPVGGAGAEPPIPRQEVLPQEAL